MWILFSFLNCWMVVMHCVCMTWTCTNQYFHVHKITMCNVESVGYGDQKWSQPCSSTQLCRVSNCLFSTLFQVQGQQQLYCFNCISLFSATGSCYKQKKRFHKSTVLYLLSRQSLSQCYQAIQWLSTCCYQHYLIYCQEPTVYLHVKTKNTFI